MITEWQPIMPEDEIKFKARTVFQFLRGDGTTYLVVGQGVDKPVKGSTLSGEMDTVAWREFDCRADSRRENPPLKATDK